jgi:Fe-S cluster biogenesis protein NfuA/nitrite reductase/ring-hydroxylating ferredoxin subunit
MSMSGEPTISSASGPVDSPADSARADGERIARLLDEVRELAGPSTWPRVEELVSRIVQLHGRGLERLLALLAEEGGLDDHRRERLAGDELVSSLLSLHDLHPVPIAARVHRALDEVRPYLASHAGGVEVLEVEAGRVRLRLVGTCHGCPSSRATVSSTLERAVLDSVPEIEELVVEGLTGGATATATSAPAASGASGGELIQLTVRRADAAPGTGGRWTRVELPAAGPAGRAPAVELEGQRVLLVQLEERWLAYQEACPACGGPLEGGALQAPTVQCPGCAARFDLLRAGRRVDDTPDHRGDHPNAAGLSPLPLLVDGAGARILLP